MKIRSDFVSNSSSSSFIVAINKEYDIKSFSKDLSKTCIDKKSEYHDKDLEYKNKLILEFCLNTYTAAFIGEWKINKTASVEYMPVTNQIMRYEFDRYGFSEDEDSKDRIKARVKYMKEYALKTSYDSLNNSDIFKITKTSLKNTRQLIDAGEKIILDNIDLDKLEKMLDDGDQIFKIRIARDGDGYGSYYIYDETEGFHIYDNIAM